MEDRDSATETHNFVLAVDLGQLTSDILRSIGTCVIDNNDLPIEAASISSIPAFITYF